jgi:hypothetical protein
MLEFFSFVKISCLFILPEESISYLILNYGFMNVLNFMIFVIFYRVIIRERNLMGGIIIAFFAIIAIIACFFGSRVWGFSLADFQT